MIRARIKTSGSFCQLIRLGLLTGPPSLTSHGKTEDKRN